MGQNKFIPILHIATINRDQTFIHKYTSAARSGSRRVRKVRRTFAGGKSFIYIIFQSCAVVPMPKILLKIGFMLAYLYAEYKRTLYRTLIALCGMDGTLYLTSIALTVFAFTMYVQCITQQYFLFYMLSSRFFVLYCCFISASGKLLLQYFVLSCT